MNKGLWKKILNTDEKVKYEFGISKNYQRMGITLGILLSLYFFVLSFFLGIVCVAFVIFYFGWYLREAYHFAFTGKRVLVKRGWLATQLISVDYEKITDITVEEPFLEKVVTRTGFLKINTAGGDSKEIVLKHLADPYKIKKKLDNIREDNEK